MNRNRLDDMEKQVNGALAIVAKKFEELHASVEERHQGFEAEQTAVAVFHEALEERITALTDEYGEIMDYMTLPWWRRLTTRRPR